MRILYITTVGMTMRFFQSFISELCKEGHTVDIACSDTESIPEYYKMERFRIYRLSCSRAPFDIGNVRSIREIRMIVRKNRYDIVHCHTPVAAACTRLACRPLRKKMALRVFYTAHGFHFCTGAPKKNWIVYYPIEKWLSRYTDVLITINKEDYRRARGRFDAKDIVYIPGVGIDVKSFTGEYDGGRIRKELGISSKAIMILSVGELNENKNQEMVVRALAKLPDEFIYVIVGEGDKRNYLEGLTKDLSLQGRVILTGYRKDVVDFYDAADLYVLPSLREGLNVSLMEAMASGLPCIVGCIRGNTDLIDIDSFTFNPTDIDSLLRVLDTCLKSDINMIGNKNRKRIRQFDREIVNSRLKALYGIN